MESFITVPKLTNEIGTDEWAGPKKLPSHLKSEYAIFDNQRTGWARDPNRIKGRNQSAMLPKMKYQEGSVMKIVNKNRNKISGSLLHYNLINREQKINHFDSWSLSLSNFSRMASFMNSDLDLYPKFPFLIISSIFSINSSGSLTDLYLSDCFINETVKNKVKNLFVPFMTQNLNRKVIYHA